MTIHLEFPDKTVSYDTFVGDLSARVARMVSEQAADPEFISQRQAYAMFGRGNVDRWRRNGLIQPCKRPGRVEYRTADLRLLQRTRQDYFKR